MIGGVQNIGRIPELRRGSSSRSGCSRSTASASSSSTPGVDREVDAQTSFAQMQGTIFGLFNMFSGGALEQLSIFALGIMPYISASIILQLLTVVVPQLEELQQGRRAGPAARSTSTRATARSCSRWSRAFFIARCARERRSSATARSCPSPGWGFRLMTMITLTTGTAFIMWLGEQITERGIGNGISLIIFAGIVIRHARRDRRSSSSWSAPTSSRCSRRSCSLAHRRRGHRASSSSSSAASGGSRSSTPSAWSAGRMYGGQATHLPLQGEHRGRHPADLRLVDPDVPGARSASFVERPGCEQFIQTYLHPGDWRYNVVYVALIIFFCFFYTAVTFNPVDVADNIKKYGRLHPGHPARARQTAEYIDRVLTRITLGGAIYISAVCVLPTLLQRAASSVPFYFGGTALLIVVGVGARHGRADRGAPHHAPLRGLRRRARAIRGQARGDDARGASLLLGPPGRRQGHAGQAPGRAARHPADLDRRHAARRGRRGHARSAARRKRCMDARRARVRTTIVIGVAEQRLAQPDARRGFILDGFPRTRRAGRGARRAAREARRAARALRRALASTRTSS